MHSRHHSWGFLLVFVALVLCCSRVFAAEIRVGPDEAVTTIQRVA
jgi:hypothetical protein